MSKITKLLFSVSQKGNPLAKLWVDDMDTENASEAFTIGIRSQVAYLFFLCSGTEVTLKKSGEWTNVVPDANFTAMFDNYKTLQAGQKVLGIMFNNAFDNAFKSLDFIGNGEVTKISKEEMADGITKFLDETIELENITFEHIKSSNSKLHKNMIKALDKDVAKPGEIAEANSILASYARSVDRMYIKKNNLRLAE